MIRMATLLLLGLLASLGVSEAKAAGCSSMADSCDQGQAYAACISNAELAVSVDPTRRKSPYCVKQEAATRFNALFQLCKSGQLPACVLEPSNAGNPTYYSAGKLCSGRSELSNVSYSGNTGMCKDGCMYVTQFGDPDPKYNSYKLNVGTPDERTFAKTVVPFGDICIAGPAKEGGFDPAKPVCTATGSSYKECVRPDGKHCVTGAKGSTLCWQPGETGPRNTEDGSLAGDRQVAPKAPAISSEIKNPTTVGNTTTTINNTTYNTTTATGTGNTGGQGNVGTGGSTGNGTGTSDGTGQGTGKGDGKGDGEEGDGEGNAGEGLGDFYEGSDDTAESVMSDFMAQVQDTPLAQQVTSFMQVEGGGSCPVFTVPATAFWKYMTFDAHCSGDFLGFLQAMGWVVLALATYCAVRIAVT